MNNLIIAIKAVQTLVPSAFPFIDFTGEYQDDKFVLLSWRTEKLGSAPTQEQIDAAISSIESVIQADGYKELRRREYPPMTDYLDGVVKGDQAQIQAYIDACLAVKAKYPKP